MDKRSASTAGYPQMVDALRLSTLRATTNYKMHIAYTYFRQRIKYVRVAEDWVKA